ncbi:MAG: hypothetical protein WC473_03525 [Patescibacteria group bacterium]|jgi:hypothetical protein
MNALTIFYIGTLVAALTFFAYSVLPTIVLVNGIKQRHNRRRPFEVDWLPPWWWMACFYAIDYIIDCFPWIIGDIRTYQTYANARPKEIIRAINEVTKDEVIDGFFAVLLSCLIIAVTCGTAVSLALVTASLLLGYLWWLTFPIIITYLIYRFFHHKCQSIQEKKKRYDENLTTMNQLIAMSERMCDCVNDLRKRLEETEANTTDQTTAVTNVCAKNIGPPRQKRADTPKKTLDNKPKNKPTHTRKQPTTKKKKETPPPTGKDEQ